ncbi:hypothetical protein G7046_g3633 [Stylonectria norvegica]|nr:hypothetical protein G7046_g3633 [Stylonectria norvegica]
MIKKNIDAKVRPLVNTSLEKASLAGAARIYISKDSLISLTGNLDNGKLCVVERLQQPDLPDQEPLRREASLWILPEKNLSPNVVMMTRAFQEATGFKLGDQVRIALAGGLMPDLEEVVLQNLDENESKQEQTTKHAPCWEYSISLSLDRAELIFPGMVFEGVNINKLRRTFKVVSVNSRSSNLALFKLETSTVRILKTDDDAAPPEDTALGGDLIVTNVPGLPTQVKAINRFFEAFSRPFYIKDERESSAFVIHGGRGTGKTFILKRIEETKWGKTHWIKPTDKLTTIRETFKLARSQQPSIIFIDGLEKLIFKDRSNRDVVIDAIGEELDSLSAGSKEQQALLRVVVIATCSDYMTDVPVELQKPQRFGENMALPIPRASERLDILKFFDPPIKPEDKERALANVAEETHAYNGADLFDLVLSAKRILINRLLDDGVDLASGETQILSMHDMEEALRFSRPTAMNDINLQPPTIHWKDIGGQENLKRVLAQMIKNTKNTKPSRVLPNPPKGLLLYGPPGCSKTLCAQAMATESGFNFFAVKGAELLNMYVGESERAVRNLFERARAASPSIIFFDEMDSIGGQRGGPDGSRSSTSGSVNMITTLLTEMDGFETLKGVLVLAATNRPEAMDPALMRPGRFDHVLYVGPPDQTAREAVFGVHLRGLSLAGDIDNAELARISDRVLGRRTQVGVLPGRAVGAGPLQLGRGGGRGGDGAGDQHGGSSGGDQRDAAQHYEADD